MFILAVLIHTQDKLVEAVQLRREALDIARCTGQHKREHTAVRVSNLGGMLLEDQDKQRKAIHYIDGRSLAGVAGLHAHHTVYLLIASTASYGAGHDYMS